MFTLATPAASLSVVTTLPRRRTGAVESSGFAVTRGPVLPRIFGAFKPGGGKRGPEPKNTSGTALALTFFFPPRRAATTLVEPAAALVVVESAVADCGGGGCKRTLLSVLSGCFFTVACSEGKAESGSTLGASLLTAASFLSAGATALATPLGVSFRFVSALGAEKEADKVADEG